MTMIFAIAAGGAIGAVARYMVMSTTWHWIGLGYHGFPGFPWGTIIVNVIGSFVLGALIETMALVWSPSEAIRAMLVIGVLGSFTTFSTFSLDVQHMIARGEFLYAGGYITGSVVASIAALLIGMALFRMIWT